MMWYGRVGGPVCFLTTVGQCIFAKDLLSLTQREKLWINIITSLFLTSLHIVINTINLCMNLNVHIYYLPCALYILPYLIFIATFLLAIFFSYLICRHTHWDLEKVGNFTQGHTSINCQTLIYTQVSVILDSNFFLHSTYHN